MQTFFESWKDEGVGRGEEDEGEREKGLGF